MGSGPIKRLSNKSDNSADTSGVTGSKPTSGSGPDSSRKIIGLPLRAVSSSPAPEQRTKGKAKMAGKDDVFEKATNIFVVLGASVNIYLFVD